MSGRDDDVNVVIHVCVLKLNCYHNKCCSLLGIVIVMNITKLAQSAGLPHSSVTVISVVLYWGLLLL